MFAQIFRSFWVMLRRFRLASALNIIGLSVAFAAFIVIVAQVRYDRSFDGFHRDAERIYRVSVTQDSTQYHAILSKPLILRLGESSPLVEQFAAVDVVDGKVSGMYQTIEQNGQKIGYKEDWRKVYPDFIEIFDFQMIEGVRETFGEPDVVIIPQSMARKFFGQESAIGQPIEMNGAMEANFTVLEQIKDRTLMTIGGVYRDFPAHTLVRNAIYVPEEVHDIANEDIGSNHYEMYVKLTSADVLAVAQEQINRTNDEVWAAAGREGVKHVRLQPLGEMYYDRLTQWDMNPKGSEATTWTLLSIAILIVVIAGINFVNFATSLAPVRIKSINTQKVLGSPTSTLRVSLIFESIGICLIAFALSLLWVYSLQELGFTALLTADITLGANVGLLALTLGVALAVGLVAGLYPAWYTTSFPPALVLKGSFGLSPQGKKLRTALVGFQFVVSIGLIIAALFMQVQNRFMRGVDTTMSEQVLVVQLNTDLAVKNQQVLTNRLKESAQVEAVAYSAVKIGGADLMSQLGRNVGEQHVNFYASGVTWEMPRVLGLEVVEGQGFKEEDARQENRLYLFNQAFRRVYPELGPGTQIDRSSGRSDRIVGFVNDYNFQSLRYGIEPMALLLNEGFMDAILSWLYVRVSGDPIAARAVIENAVHSIDPTYPVTVEFQDQVFEQLYVQEGKTVGLITGFSLLAVIISLVGVFGLVVFETQYRKKEIGVRRVHGATVGEILAMFNRRFVWIVAICFLVAAPLAWYGITEWLGNFAYRTPLHWWVFACSLLVVLLITLLTVTVQSWRAATTNPVESLKTE